MLPILPLLFLSTVMSKPITPPFRTNIPEPFLVFPIHHSSQAKASTFLLASNQHVKFRHNPRYSHVRQLHSTYNAHRVRRWMLPSWGWVGVRTFFGHADAEWETFRRKIVSAYETYENDEGEKFRILWIEDEGRLDRTGDIV
jgi:hypothetical protein